PRARAARPRQRASGGAPQGGRAGDHQAGAIGLAARRVRRHRQQAADFRSLRPLRRGGQRHPHVFPAAAMTVRTVVRQSLRLAAAGALVAAGIALDTRPGEAHKAITSKYTYNDDVFPIFRERCSRCHVPGGVAPMSLMTYDEAFPWAESIRAELVAAHMPPWIADDGFGELKRAHTLTSKELDVIMTWASGGNPRGALDQKLPEVTLKN